MAESPNSSFIPNAPVKGGAAAPRGRKVYILSYISFVIFFGTLIATGIVFFLGFQQDKALALQEQRLDEEAKKFGDAALIEIREVSDRLAAASQVLDSNTSPVTVLLALERSMLDSIGVTAFSYKKTSEGAYLLEMEASAPSFNAPRFQREIIASNPILDGATITEASYGTVEGENGSAGVSSDGVLFKISKVFTAADIPHLDVAPFALEALGGAAQPEPVTDLGTEVTAPAEDTTEATTGTDTTTEATTEPELPVVTGDQS